MGGTSDGVFVLSRFIVNGATSLGEIRNVNAFMDFWLCQDVDEGITFSSCSAIVYRNSGLDTWRDRATPTTMMTFDGTNNYTEVQNIAVVASTSQYVFDFKQTFVPFSAKVSDNLILSAPIIIARIARPL